MERRSAAEHAGKQAAMARKEPLGFIDMDSMDMPPKRPVEFNQMSETFGSPVPQDLGSAMPIPTNAAGKIDEMAAMEMLGGDEGRRQMESVMRFRDKLQLEGHPIQQKLVGPLGYRKQARTGAPDPDIRKMTMEA